MPRKAKAVDEQDALIARSIGSRIKKVREDLGLPPKEFGAICGVSQAQQYRIESGERVPDLIYLAKLKAKRGVGVERLLPEVLPEQEATRPGEKAATARTIKQRSSGAGSIMIAEVGGNVNVAQPRTAHKSR